MTALRAVVLDFDGVIVESNDVKTAAFGDVFARFPEHAERMMAYHHANVSVSRFAKFDYLLAECLGRGDDSALRDDLASEFSRRTVQRVAECEYVPGAPELLEEFAPRVPLYLASVTPQADLDSILERRGIRAYFRDVFGCPPWTKEQATREVLRREGCAGEECVLVGDSEGDQRAAVAAGVRFIARDSGLPFASPPQEVHADLLGVATSLRLRLN